MCHELWSWRERRRSERFDEELRYLLDEEPESKEPTPVRLVRRVARRLLGRP